jgi:hypothetical protein
MESAGRGLEQGGDVVTGKDEQVGKERGGKP